MFYYLVLFPNATNGFVYSSDANVPLGMRVLVNFRGTERVGFVYSEEKEPGYPTKPIIDVLDETVLLRDDLRKTIDFVSFYYVSERGLVLRSAFPKRIFTIREPIDVRPVDGKFLWTSDDRKLTRAQRRVYEEIAQEKGFNVNLLFGVTGSGKTEIYLRLIKRVLEAGGKALVLVPEIVLTPQYVDVFSSRFGEDVVRVFHSRLTPKQRLREYLDFKRRAPAVMIGTRSAVFVDFEGVGIVVVDEENDDSYKQENTPRYNAKDVVIYRAKLRGIPVVLGSATPLVEDYYKARSGKYRLFELTERVGVSMPRVTFVPVGSELLAEGARRKIQDTKDASKTVAVLINRRGFANYVVCRACGNVLVCPNCSVSLTYHKSSNSLKCHWCDASFPVFLRCPKCRSVELEPVGFGTQRVEEELRKEFPGFKVERLDRDSVSTKGEFDRILGELRAGRIDILVGTQMLSKGHDISHIGLVVILNADSMIGVPDFRANERFVALLIQTAGRSGRQGPGEVIIQGTSGENELVGYVIKHDFKAFLETEIERRRPFGYPPFSHLIRIVVEHRNEDKALEISKGMESILKSNGFSVVGVSKCPLYRMKNYYRFHILLKTDKVIAALRMIHRLKRRGIYFDVDPVNFF